VAGRFLSVDPVTTDVGTGGNFNRYVYGNNNPYRFKDPDGRIAKEVAILAAGAALLRATLIKSTTFEPFALSRA
jgi:hypothetical protein